MADVVDGGFRRAAKDSVGFGALIVQGAEGGGSTALVTRQAPLTSSTPVNVASSATVVTLQAANTARRAWSVFNDSTATLYLKEGAAASTTDHKVQVPPGGYYESPMPIYTGIITGIWSAANGFARVVEGV